MKEAAGAAAHSRRGRRAAYGAAPPASRLLAHRLRRRPAAGPDPGDHCGPWAAGTKGQAQGLPPPLARHPRPGWPPRMVNEERVNLPALLRRLLEPAQYTSAAYAALA